MHGQTTSGLSSQSSWPAFATVAAVVLAFAALDDITTDDAASFVLERAIVAGCGLWFAYAAYQLWHRHRRVLAVVSAGVLILAALAQPVIGPGAVPGVRFWLAYLATMGALVWFLAVAAVLFALTSSTRRI